MDKITLDRIKGYSEEKAEIRNIITLLNEYDKYESQGLTIPRGLIFQGPPGTGKTLFAKAIAGECDYDFFVALDENTEEQSLDDLKKVFKKAEKSARETGSPALIYIDELDKIVYTNSYGDLVDAKARDATRFLLQKLDENKTKNKILIIASTNCYDRIPEALLRSGRFDKKFLIDLPDAESRKEILEYYINNHPLFKNINLNKLALKTAGMSGADLKTLINNTLLEYIAKKDSITLEDFIKIINEMNFETIGKKWTSSEVALEVLAHEIGHEIVQFEMCGVWGNVNAIRFGDVEGSTSIESIDEYEEFGDFDDIVLNEIEEKNQSAEDIIKSLYIDLAGKAGEEIFLNKTSIGLGGDIENVKQKFNILCSNGAFGFKYCNKLSYFGIPPQTSYKLFKFITKKCVKIYKKTKRIVKKNKLLCLYLIDEIHKNNDCLSSQQIKEKYNYFLEHYKEIKEKYKKLTILDLIKKEDNQDVTAEEK